MWNSSSFCGAGYFDSGYLGYEAAEGIDWIWETPHQRPRPIGDLTVLDIEAQRQIVQERLDAANTAAERNRLGQFATPPNLALDIARYAFELWRGRSDAVSFLDPAIGTDPFDPCCRTFPTQAIADACGVELESAIVVFEKSPAPDHHQVRFSFGGPITNPASSEMIALRHSSRRRNGQG